MSIFLLFVFLINFDNLGEVSGLLGGLMVFFFLDLAHESIIKYNISKIDENRRKLRVQIDVKAIVEKQPPKKETLLHQV